MIARNIRTPWIVAVIVSLGIHAGMLHSYSFSAGESKGGKTEIIELVPLPRYKHKNQEPEQPEDNKGQVVDLGPEDLDDKTPPPEHARFLSERNMRVDNEMVKPSRTRTGSPRRPGQDKHPYQERENGRVNKQTGLESQAPIKNPQDFSRDELMVSMADIKHALEADDGSIDYLPDVLKGELTALNAKKYTYAAFYNRIKKIIRFYWNPARALEKINWRGATLETRLRVVINRDGTLDLVEVLSSSGYPLVDAAAVRAIRKAAPFYNVPPGLLDKKGKLDDMWAFYITSE